jgi:hypothetical protein
MKVKVKVKKMMVRTKENDGMGRGYNARRREVPAGVPLASWLQDAPVLEDGERVVEGVLAVGVEVLKYAVLYLPEGGVKGRGYEDRVHRVNQCKAKYTLNKWSANHWALSMSMFVC